MSEQIVEFDAEQPLTKVGELRAGDQLALVTTGFMVRDQMFVNLAPPSVERLTVLAGRHPDFGPCLVVPLYPPQDGESSGA